MLITVIADKFGHKVGGLIATAPVTATVGVIFVLKNSDPHLAKEVVLAGNYSVIAAIAAVVGYFYAVKLSRNFSNTAKVFTAEIVFFVVYISGIFLLRCYLPVGWYLFEVDLVLLLGSYFTFMRARIEIFRTPLAVKRTLGELAVRFVSGFVVFLVIKFFADLETVISGAIAVFPGVFATSIGFMGIRQSAEFSAKAVQAGIFGVAAIAFFVFGYSVWIPALSKNGNFALIFATLTALVFYFASLYFLGRMKKGARQFHCLQNDRTIDNDGGHEKTGTVCKGDGAF